MEGANSKVPSVTVNVRQQSNNLVAGYVIRLPASRAEAAPTIEGNVSPQPFEAELDRYVESVVLSQAAALGDAAALAAWMEQEAAGWRKSVAIACCWMRKPADQAPREIAPLGSYDRAVQSRMLDLDLASANLLEQLAREVREARPPRTRH
jgi:hypothetical protein